MSSSNNDNQRPEGPPRMVKWSPPYRRENVEMPEFDLIEIERIESDFCSEILSTLLLLIDLKMLLLF